MTYIHSTLFILHILFGTAALILFWVPMTTKKGQLNHRKFGKAYKNVMYAVAATGALMAVIVLAIPLVIKHEYANAENASQIAENLRFFWAFLLYLALLSFVSTHHGDKVLKVKNDRAKLRTPLYVAPLVMLFVGGIVLLGIGIYRDSMLHMLFGILGMLIGYGNMRYVFKQNFKNGAYLLEHIGSMIGSGIGAYTAFITFGARQLIDGLGMYQIIFWLAPGVLGTILSFYLTKKYARVYLVNTGDTQTA